MIFTSRCGIGKAGTVHLGLVSTFPPLELKKRYWKMAEDVEKSQSDLRSGSRALQSGVGAGLD